MALRGIQEYIARDVNNIARVEDLSKSRSYILNHFYLTTCLWVQIMVPDGVYLVVGKKMTK